MREAPSKTRAAAFLALFTAAGRLAIDTSGLMADRSHRFDNWQFYAY